MKVYCRACFLFCSRNYNPLRLWAKWVIIALVYMCSLIGGNVGTALLLSDDSKVCYETVWFGSCYWDAFPLTFLFLTPLYLIIATFIVAWRNSRPIWKKAYDEAKGYHQLINENAISDRDDRSEERCQVENEITVNGGDDVFCRDDYIGNDFSNDFSNDFNTGNGSNTDVERMLLYQSNLT